MSVPRPAAVVVLAAGEGKRMRSALPKVLHEVGGRPLLGHVLHAASGLESRLTAVVIGVGRELVGGYLAESHPVATPVVQEQQHGTGHAVRIALESLTDLEDGTVVVLPGDSPLLTAESLRQMLDVHHASGAAATLLTARVPDPTGYGRVVRDGSAVVEIVEHRDASDAQREIDEVATSVYAFDGALLRDALARITRDNAQGEEYLTDVIGLLRADGATIAAHVTPDHAETAGINDRVQLAEAIAHYRQRRCREAMLAGATIVDPATTWIDADVTLDPDVVLLPGTRLLGRTHVAGGAVIGPHTTMADCSVGPGATIESSTCRGAVIGEQASVGPYSFLRPGAVLGRKAKVGAYVEVKGSTIGDDSKVPHLSYVGDTTIGRRSNIGAATVTVNYDGVAKHKTVIGDDVRIGSDTMLVAPVTVGDGAYTAAGSVITSDVPPGALGVGRAQQRNIEGWVARRRTGSNKTDHTTPQGESTQ